MRKRVVCLVLCAGFTALSQPAQAQGYRSSDPNMRNFYMGRQQWQYIDESPVVTGTPPTPGAQGQGSLPAAPAQLPKAGWQPYSSSIPSVKNALPQVNNGVPKPVPAAPAGPAGLKGKAGNLKPGSVAAKPSGPQAVKTYSTYKGYGGQAPAAGAHAAVGAGTSTSTNVKGNVLRWTRPTVRY